MEKAIRFEKPHEVHTAVGKEICVTDWVTVDQQRIDKFAEATGDFQWIHVDVERAKASTYGGTIAHISGQQACPVGPSRDAARYPRDIRRASVF